MVTYEKDLGLIQNSGIGWDKSGVGEGKKVPSMLNVFLLAVLPG